MSKSDSFEDLPPFVASGPRAVHYGPDGGEVEIGITTNIGDTEIVREIVADQFGVAPEALSDRPRTKLGRLSVGFRRWNSPWDPRAEREAATDPTLN